VLNRSLVCSVALVHVYSARYETEHFGYNPLRCRLVKSGGAAAQTSRTTLIMERALGMVKNISSSANPESMRNCGVHAAACFGFNSGMIGRLSALFASAAPYVPSSQIQTRSFSLDGA
jgi:hypothetical protein